MAEYIVDGKVFKTKKACFDYARRILKKTIINMPLEGKDLSFITALLHTHKAADQKIGCGIKKIYVRREPIFNGRHFTVLRTDGTEIEFSFLKCLSANGMKTNRVPEHLQNVKRALRTAITDDVYKFKIERFKEKGLIQCPYTKEYLDFYDSHVDHKYPNTFDKLVFDWLYKNKLKVSDIKVTGETILNLVDEKLLDSFVQFHNKKAKLRIISAEANRSLPIYKGLEWDLVM